MFLPVSGHVARGRQNGEEAPTISGCKCSVDMPITTEVYRVLYESKSPNQAVSDLWPAPIDPSSSAASSRCRTDQVRIWGDSEQAAVLHVELLAMFCGCETRCRPRGRALEGTIDRSNRCSESIVEEAIVRTDQERVRILVSPRHPEEHRTSPAERRVRRNLPRVAQERRDSEVLARLPVVVVPRKLERTAANIGLPGDARVERVRRPT